jgi:hypothetical protein
VAKLENARVLYENFVRSGQGEAKFWLHPMVHLDNSSGFDARTLRELAQAVEQNATLIEKAWNATLSLAAWKLNHAMARIDIGTAKIIAGFK